MKEKKNKRIKNTSAVLSFMSRAPFMMVVSSTVNTPCSGFSWPCIFNNSLNSVVHQSLMVLFLFFLFLHTFFFSYFILYFFSFLFFSLFDFRFPFSIFSFSLFLFLFILLLFTSSPKISAVVFAKEEIEDLADGPGYNK